MRAAIRPSALLAILASTTSSSRASSSRLLSTRGTRGHHCGMFLIYLALGRGAAQAERAELLGALVERLLRVNLIAVALELLDEAPPTAARLAPSCSLPASLRPVTLEHVH